MHAEKNISLVKFYRTALESARKSGYLYIACIVSRYAEFEKGFDYLEKHWSSFNDLSGEEILILVSGEGIRGKVESAELVGIVDNSEARLSNSDIVISGDLENIKRKGNYLDSQLKEDEVESTFSKSSHSGQTSDLMEYFGIAEKQLPALCLTSVLTGTTLIYKLDGTKGDEFYKVLKFIKSKLESYLNTLLQLGDNLSLIQTELSLLESQYKDYISYTRDELNTSFADWRARRFDVNKEIDEFVSNFIKLTYKETPIISQGDARIVLKSIAKDRKRYQSGRKRLDKYYSIVKYETNENYMVEKSALIKQRKTLLLSICEQEYKIANELSKYLKIETIKDIKDAFDSEINLWVTKVDVKTLIDRIKKIASRVSSRF